MRIDIREFLKEYNYHEDAEKVIISAYEELAGDEAFEALAESFYGTDMSAEMLTEKLNEFCGNFDICTVQLIYFIALTPYLKEKYQKLDISEDAYSDAVEDLRTKMMECHEVRKVWGIIPVEWFCDLFRMKIFAMGRMQYAVGKYHEDVIVAGRTVRKGDDVVIIHIPSSGKPFDRESRLASYEKAYYFFKKYLGGKEPVFCCNSWLLNPPNREILGEKSNIVSFMEDFRIVHSFEYPDNRNLWRIFGADAELPPKDLPRTTKLQKAFADWLKQGNRLGSGIGFFLYDPVNKTTLK